MSEVNTTKPQRCSSAVFLACTRVCCCLFFSPGHLPLGVRQSNRTWAQCALHLRQYNDALLINDTLRMIDAFGSLDAFYQTKINSAIDGTDRFLLALFQGTNTEGQSLAFLTIRPFDKKKKKNLLVSFPQENKTELRTVAEDSRFENPKMSELEKVLLQQFGPSPASRAILFSKTRKSTHCLLDWVTTNAALQNAAIKAAILTGAGGGLDHMTQVWNRRPFGGEKAEHCMSFLTPVLFLQNEQKETISSFRQGHLNLLIATSVAEEGLDIPQCNLVVRYGLLTNAIAQKQAVGRARAADSRYSVVAEEGGKELCREKVNDRLEELTEAAVAKVQEMSPADFRREVRGWNPFSLPLSSPSTSLPFESRPVFAV